LQIFSPLLSRSPKGRRRSTASQFEGNEIAAELLSAFVTVFVTIGPIETAVVFAALTAGVHRPERKSLAARSITIAGVVLLLFALGGGGVLSLLRVSLPAFRVAGGVLLFLQALTLTFSNPGLSSINASETRDAQGAGDIAIFPLAFPVIAGPGSLAAVVLVMGRTGVWLERAAVVLMVAICLAVTYVAMIVSERLVRRLGQTGSDLSAEYPVCCWQDWPCSSSSTECDRRRCLRRPENRPGPRWISLAYKKSAPWGSRPRVCLLWRLGWPGGRRGGISPRCRVCENAALL
jgi:multiple antibiotic resistance protein